MPANCFETQRPPGRFFLGWRPRQGSNLQPSASKADALSIELRGQPRELQSLTSIVMAELHPLPSKITMIVIVASMSLLVGLIAATVALD